MKKEKQKQKEIPKKKYDEQAVQQTFFDMLKPEKEDDDETPDIKETIETWLDKKHIHSKTRLTPNQVIALTILKTLSEKYGVTCIKELIDWFVTYKLSEGGKSSSELVDILKNRTEINTNDDLMSKIAPFVK